MSEEATNRAAAASPQQQGEGPSEASPRTSATAGVASAAAASSARSRSSTNTVTITETETEELPEILELTLRARPSVRWDESVVDNEGMGRKSSKRCCIFHKQRAFGESSTDSSDYDSDRSGSSTASGADGDSDDDGEKKRRTYRKGKIARPKKGDKLPDYQRFHA